MKKTIDLDFSEMLETCLRFARVRMRIFSEIIEKGVDMERTIEIFRDSSGEDVAEQRMREEFGISRAASRSILDSHLRKSIIGNAQDYLEYYREAAEKLTAVLSKNPEK